MKANNDKHLEKFVDKLMKETSLETPSPEFTSKLMLQVQATEMEKAAVYKPLIPKAAWFIIFGAIFVLTIFIVFNTNLQSSGLLWGLDLDSINDRMFKSLSMFRLSDISLYAVVLLSVMLLVQVTFLKRYFNKRFEA